ncbi:UNVERIFIED_CONTAM: hypothetical protein GTU68_026111 [Idotea baltica]|nr:hypothetical protein [Idotea baltica]
MEHVDTCSVLPCTRTNKLPTNSSPYKALFTPFTLGSLRLKNRIISTSHAPAYAEDGMPGERYQRYHEEKAKGGLALTMFGGASSVSQDSPASFGQLDVSSNRIVPYFKQFSDRIHAHDVGIICQLSHAGRRTRPTSGNWLPTVAPSAIREPAHGAMPKVLELSDIKRISSDYAEAAYRCYEGGLDGIELLVSGHLIGQFWSELSNKRNDAYGGSLNNRLRFGMEVLASIRDRVPQSFIVSLRFTANEFVEGGIDEAQGIEIAKLHAESGLVDCLNVSGGANWTKAGVAETVPSMAFASGRFVELAGKIRAATNLPVLHAAGVADFATANNAVNEGHVDLIGMTRAQIADPHMVRKHLAGDDGAIRPCVGAGYCIDRIYKGGDALCLHNAVTGRESVLSHTITQSTTPKRVVIVGAGPAGLEAARICQERGHTVLVLEAQNQAGGQVVYAARVEWRQSMLGITRWLYDRCDELGVQFHFNKLAEMTDVLNENPDIVIIATGGLPDFSTIAGAEESAHSVWDILSKDVQALPKVLVYDETGSQSGPTVAEFLANAGSEVDIATPDRMIAEDVGVTNHAIHLRELYKAGVTLRPDSRLTVVKKVGNRLQATLRNEYSAQDEHHEYDQVIVETGTIPTDELYEDLLSQSSNNGELQFDALLNGETQPSVIPAIENNNSFALYRIGDCVSARGIHAAVLDATRLCMNI